MKVWNAGQHAGLRVTVSDAAGRKVPFATSVVFDGDGNEGTATVTRYDADEKGAVRVAAVNPIGFDSPLAPVVITERMWVRIDAVPLIPELEPDTPLEVRS